MEEKEILKHIAILIIIGLGFALTFYIVAWFYT